MSSETYNNFIMMPFSFNNFSASAIILMVALLAVAELIKVIRHRLKH